MITIDLNSDQGKVQEMAKIVTRVCQENHINHVPIVEEMMMGGYRDTIETVEKYLGTLVRFE